MFHIKSLFPKFLQKQGIKKQVEAVEICKIADRILKEAFCPPAGEVGNNNAKAAFFRNSTLQIKCSNSTLANEIQLQNENIKNEINKEMGKVIVKNILTKIG
jgi:tRNA U54 and U55 pseudouridine synthase Pus10